METLESCRKLVEEAIKEFNETRSPEVIAELSSWEGEQFVVAFRLTCVTCGLSVWPEDLLYLLRERGLQVVLEAVADELPFVLAVYRLLTPSS